MESTPFEHSAWRLANVLDRKAFLLRRRFYDFSKEVVGNLYM